MIYKASQFNIRTESTNGDLLLTNLYTSNYIKVQKDDKDMVLATLKNPETISPNNQLFFELIKRGFLVEQDTNEYSLMEYEYYKAAYANRGLHITIVPTHDCNFDCVYCYQHCKNNPMSPETEAAFIIFINKNIHNYTKLVLSWFGGEPLLCKDTVFRITQAVKEICRAKGVPCITQMTTNGYLLDPETFERLLNSGLLYYQITIDGPKAIHDKQRPLKCAGSSFDGIIANLEAIKKLKIKRYFRIAIRVNVTPFLNDEIKALLDFMGARFGDDKQFWFDINKARDWGSDKNDEINNFYYEQNEFNEKCRQIEDYALEKHLRVFESSMFQIGSGICDAEKENSFIIDYDGSIHKCTIAMFRAEHRHLSTVGYLDSAGKLNWDKSHLAKWMVNNKKSDHCKLCKFLLFCMAKPCPYAINILQKDKCILKEGYNLEQRIRERKQWDTIEIHTYK